VDFETGGGTAPIIDFYAANKGRAGNSAHKLAFTLVPVPGADEMPDVIANHVKTNETTQTGFVHERNRTPIVDGEFARYELRY
jgi:hypothetical protein